MVILRNYIIWEKMMFMIGVSRGSRRFTLVCEVNRSFLVEQSPEEIIEETCNYYGFDYHGALKAGAKVLGTNKLGPFIVNPNNTVCLFSSKSPLRSDSYYMNIQHIHILEDIGSETKVLFNNGHTISIPTRKNHLHARKCAAKKLRTILTQRKFDFKNLLMKYYREYEFCRETGIYMLEDEDEEA